MGNVMAASSPASAGLSSPGSIPPPPPPTVGVPPGFVKLDESDAKTQKTVDGQNGFENPGTIEDLHKKCKGNRIHFSPNLFYFKCTISYYTMHFPIKSKDTSLYEGKGDKG